MWKKLFSLALMVLLCHAGNALLVRNVRAQGGTVDDKVKSSVAKRGTGPKAKVTVKLKDKTKLKGYITSASSDSFTLSDSKPDKLEHWPIAMLPKLKSKAVCHWPRKLVSESALLLVCWR